MKSVEDYLYLANIFTASQERLYFKLNQIERNEYSWLPKEIVAQCLYRFKKVVLCEQTKPEVEVTIINPMMTEENKMINALLQPFFPKENFLFTARMDMICDDMWEFKCVSNITVEHFMQVMIYAWIWKAISPDDERKFKIFNIKTGEIFVLTKSLEELTPWMVLLLKSKYKKLKKKTDDEFMEQWEL
jgi:hypothetical protein